MKEFRPRLNLCKERNEQLNSLYKDIAKQNISL
jgi:hypothetical protein